jgi:iron complex outermembrane receptor protein
MSIFCRDGRFVPGFSCAFFTPIKRSQATTNGAAHKRRLRFSVAPFGLQVCLCVGQTTAVLAQTTTPTAQGSGDLGPVVVTEPQRKPVKRTQAASTPVRTSARTTKRPVKPAVPAPASTPTASSASPLNTNAVASSASRLGLTVREIPATIEVIDQKTIRDRGYRTTTEVAQGTVGVTGGDGPGEPGAFSMRGFCNSQINILYNGIRIGPQNMTSRYMDTANLDSVEILKGPASLLSGEGASGGAINFVNKQPTSGPCRTKPSSRMTR